MAPGTESENPQGRSASGPTISLWNLFVHYLTKYLVVELVVVIIALLYFCLVVILVLFSIALVDEPHTGLPGLFINIQYYAVQCHVSGGHVKTYRHAQQETL